MRFKSKEYVNMYGIKRRKTNQTKPFQIRLTIKKGHCSIEQVETTNTVRNYLNSLMPTAPAPRGLRPTPLNDVRHISGRNA